MRTLVTGGAGFIGFHVSKGLLKRGEEVTIIDNFNQYYDQKLKIDRIKQLKTNKLEVIKEDISDFDALFRKIKDKRIDKICHLAAQAGVRYSIENPFIYEKTNVRGTLNIFECARRLDINKVVFASSSSVYGNHSQTPYNEEQKVNQPESIYAATKISNETMAYTYHRIHDIQVVGLRLFTVYGPWGRPDMAMHLFTDKIMNGHPIDLFNHGDLKRDFTFVSDIREGLLSALDKNLGFEIINLGCGEPVELRYFVKCIEKSTNKKAKIRLLPMQKGDVYETFADIKKAKSLLNYEPQVSIEEGVSYFVEWFKKYYEIKK